MRIFDQSEEKSLKKVTLLLEESEASELISTLDDLLKNKNSSSYHSHISDSGFVHEITITLYRENNLENYNERIIKLIKEDI